VSSGHNLQLVPRKEEAEERNWMPLMIAAGVVVLVAVAVIFAMQRGHKPATVTPISAAADPYAANLPVSGLAMSESSNLAGGKVTYVDGKIANKGSRAVTGITVQVLFHNVAREVTRNDTQPLKLIRTRDPYVDTEPVSAAPLAPGDERDFRLIFDAAPPDWDGAYPQIRIIQVDTK
jgi:Protein of unknown function (DUF2393)